MSFSIKLNLYSEGTNLDNLSAQVLTTEFNNISSQTLLLEQKELPTPFILEENEDVFIVSSKFGDSSKMVEQYEGLIFKATSSYDITLTGLEKIKFLYLKFNEKYYNEIGSILLDVVFGEEEGLEQFSKNDFNSNIWLINMENKKDEEGTVHLYFHETAGLCILDYISLDFSIETKEKYIKNLTIGERISSDNTKPEFGVVGQYGECQIIDKNSKIMNLSKDGAFLYDYTLSILYNNEIIKVFSKPQWSYEEENKVFNVTLENDFEYMKSIIIPKLNYSNNYNCLRWIATLLSYSKYTYNISDDLIIYLLNLNFNDFYMKESSNLYLELIKVCNLAQICCIIKNVNELEFFKYV